MKNSPIIKRLLYTRLNKAKYTFILCILTITFSSQAQNTRYGSNVGNGGDKNSFFGATSGRYNQTGSYNAYIGYASGRDNKVGSQNTFLGYGSGTTSVGSGNIFIGTHAGYGEKGSNKLHIHNNNVRDPLIWGDFASRIVNINGDFGIGTMSPKEKLHVNGNIYSNGSIYSKGNIKLYANEGEGRSGIAYIQASDKSNRSNISLQFRTQRWDKSIDVLKMTSLGNIGIGTVSPTEKLDVVGNIRVSTGDIKVNDGNVLIGQSQLSSSTDSANTMLTVTGGVKTDKVVLNIGSFPDYVFANDYPLMPIEEVAAYITENKHLPNIPSEKEMVVTGLDVTAISVKLVEKIEELTLYTIAQQENIESQKVTNNSQQALLALQQELIIKLAQRLEKLEKSK